MQDSASHRPDGGIVLQYTIPDDERPSVAVIRAITNLTDDELTEIPPLFESVDPEALDLVCSSDDAQIEFDYHGYRIRVAETTVSLS